MHTVPKHLTATIRRTDHPEDPPDTLDEANPHGWTVLRLAAFLRRTYGPTVEADVTADGERFRVTGASVVKLAASQSTP